MRGKCEGTDYKSMKDGKNVIAYYSRKVFFLMKKFLAIQQKFF